MNASVKNALDVLKARITATSAVVGVSGECEEEKGGLFF